MRGETGDGCKSHAAKTLLARSMPTYKMSANFLFRVSRRELQTSHLGSRCSWPFRGWLGPGSPLHPLVPKAAAPVDRSESEIVIAEQLEHGEAKPSNIGISLPAVA